MASEAGIARRLLQAGIGTWVLAAVCAWALLVWLAALLGMGGRVAEPALPKVTPLPPPPAVVADRVGPLSRYPNAAARPLFTPDRRPRSFVVNGQEQGDGAPASQSLDFILTGVVISPQVRLAILQPNGGGDSRRVREGDAPDGAPGWRLVDVQPRRALFEGNGGQVTLDLRRYGEAGPPVLSAVPPASTDAATRLPAPPPPPPPSPAPQKVTAVEPPPTAARVEEIRRRIEARRAQLATTNPPGNEDRPLPPAAPAKP